jgi:hypothetical protein
MNWVRLSMGAAFVGLCLAGASEANAQASNSCQTDFGKITARRQVEIDAINAMTKKFKGKLDPIGACPHLRNLSTVETELITYMTNNKDWCSIPDEAIANATEGHKKTVAFAGKACAVAAQVKKQQAQQAQQPQQNGNAFNAPEKLRLPSGPL